MSDTKNEMQAFIAVKVARVLKHIGTTHLAIEEIEAKYLPETSAILQEMLADMQEELKALRLTEAAYEELRLRSLEGVVELER
jgi:hypothetical protein